MKNKAKKHFSIRMKINIFVIITVLAVAIGTSVIAFKTSADQIDQYYKQCAADNARNFASLVDGDYLERLRAVAESNEYQELRDKAEEEDNEKSIEEYLRSAGVWYGYNKTREMITKYLQNMEGIKYLYVVAHGDKDSDEDMYLVDDESVEMYETGMYEDREEALKGVDLTKQVEPRISTGDWGWLCSAFHPVYNSQNKCVCIVGCDFGMDEVMQERSRLLIYLAIGTLILTTIVLVGAMLFIKKIVVTPINAMTHAMSKFTPHEHASYDEAGVVDLNIESVDEIGQIYHGIRSMQINIIDYLNDLSTLKEDNLKAEKDIEQRDEEIGKLSGTAYTDALTGVGNKAAYIKKTEELNKKIEEENLDFAIVMADINNLKKINDNHGHKSGDMYITGCCRILSDAFKTSPIFRIGGDEFVIILTDADFDNRETIVSNLKTEFLKCFGKKNVNPWERYSAAIGLAEKTFEDNTIEFVFKRADEHMYEDKAAFKKKYGNYRQ